MCMEPDLFCWLCQGFEGRTSIEGISSIWVHFRCPRPFIVISHLLVAWEIGWYISYEPHNFCCSLHNKTVATPWTLPCFGWINLRVCVCIELFRLISVVHVHRSYIRSSVTCSLTLKFQPLLNEGHFEFCSWKWHWKWFVSIRLLQFFIVSLFLIICQIN